MALIVLMIMQTQTYHVDRGYSNFGDYNYTGNLTPGMAKDYNQEDSIVNAVLGGMTTLTPLAEIQLSLNAIMSDCIDWLMCDDGADAHVTPLNYASDDPLLSLGCGLHCVLHLELH